MAAKCALYRHFDAEDKLLYVGISLRPFTRIKEHSAVSDWGDAIANVRIEYFPTRKEALAAEAKAVQEENPLYNIRLRKPKKEPKRAAVVEAKAEEQRITLTQRVIRFDPLYKVNEAANALGISTTILKREIEEGNLSVTMIRSPVVGRMNPYITGWQLIDWLESQELKSMGANND